MIFKNMVFKTKKTLNLSGSIIDLSTPAVMGILNLTPDSFFDGGYYKTETGILNQVEKMLSEGAVIIDIGGASSKPNAELITEKEELDRVMPVIKLLKKKFSSIKISIDTYRSSIACEALNEGACVINDISGGDLDKKMFELMAERNVPYVLMHMKGTPQTMAGLINYDALISEIFDILQGKINTLRSMGVCDIIVDPGFGFSKNITQNYSLLKNLSYFKLLEIPILAGISRKSMIYKKLDIIPEDALNGTTVLNTMALINGASILRVHDVKEAVEAVKLFKETYL
jgi:dihydropteroate synthase